MKRVSIRAFTSDDLPRILDINQANVPEVGSADLERLRFIAAESPIALVAEVDDSVVGFVLVLAPGSSYDSVNYRWFMDRYDDAMYLDRVAIDATAQGRGIGSQLYAKVDAQIAVRRAAGLAGARLALEVNVDPPNEPSLAFHAKHGFAEVGRLPGHDGIKMSMMTKTY